MRQFLRVVIDVSPAQAVHHVAVYRDGALLESDFAAPFEVAWNTTQEPDGSHTLTAKAFGAEFGEATSPEVPVTVDNSPPTILLKAPRDGAALLGLVQVEAEAADAFGVASVRLLVNGRELETDEQPPYVFRWDSNRIFNGTHALQARALDRAGNSATSGSVAVTITNANRPPVLSHIGPKALAEETTLRVQLQASDPDGERDLITYRGATLPEWANVDPKSGEFWGTPSYDEASLSQPTKTYEMVLEACDPEPLCDREQIEITVENSNRAPVLDPIQDLVVSEQQPASVTFLARDPDGDELLWKASRLPPWMSFDADAARLSGTPGAAVASQEKREVTYQELTIEVCDPQPSCATHKMTVKVTDANRPPAWRPISHQTIVEARLLLFDVQAADPDQDSLVLDATPLPDGASFVDHEDGRGTFSWTPRLDQGGDYSLIFRAFDGVLDDQRVVRIAIEQASLAISGRIIDILDRPLAGATVYLDQATGTVQRATTDAHGFYLISGLRAGEYTVRPDHQMIEEFTTKAKKLGAWGFRPNSQRVVIGTTDQTGVDFQAYPP